MRYEIQYLLDGAILASVMHAGPLDAVCRLAGADLARFGAKAARVFDMLTGAEICSVLPSAPT